MRSSITAKRKNRETVFIDFAGGAGTLRCHRLKTPSGCELCWAIEGLRRRRSDRQTTGGLGNVTRAFSHRNYGIYVSGNGISLIGSWLQRVAVGWLAWTLTHSGAWLGLISLAEFLPVLYLAPLAGVLADRHDRVRTIRITQLRLRPGEPAGDPRSAPARSRRGAVRAGVAARHHQRGRAAGAAGADPEPGGPASLPSALAINSIVFNSPVSSARRSPAC